MAQRKESQLAAMLFSPTKRGDKEPVGPARVDQPTNRAAASTAHTHTTKAAGESCGHFSTRAAHNHLSRTHSLTRPRKHGNEFALHHGRVSVAAAADDVHCREYYTILSCVTRRVIPRHGDTSHSTLCDKNILQKNCLTKLSKN